MFCAAGLVFGGKEGVDSNFHVLRARTSFRRYRGRWVPFSYFALPDSFSAVPGVSGPVFMFCASILIFGGTEGVGSRFHILRSRTLFRRYLGRQVPFTCFARPDSFSTVPRASVPIFIFCALGLVFDSTVVVKSRFHILRSLTRFRRYRGRRVPSSCLARPELFPAVSRASVLVFKYCAARLVFGGKEGIGFRFHVLRFWAPSRLYRGRRVSISCFALPDSFLAVPRGSGAVFIFCAPDLIFDGTEGVGSRFHILSSKTCFRRYRGRWDPFSFLARPDLFSTVPRPSGPVFIFCAPKLVFGGTEGLGSYFHVLRIRAHFLRYGGRRVAILFFALPDSFSGVPMASVPVFMFCALGLVFGGTEGVKSCFHILRARTRFLRYRGRRFPFSCFARPNSFSTVPRASVPVF
jgi:hypothetical protein